jgi:NTP pyrophosphatase (non-canonical NTP hydrolase)
LFVLFILVGSKRIVMTERKSVYDNIRDERKRQDAKWGTDFAGRTDERWLAILAEEFGEIAEAMLRNNDVDVIMEIIQTAAVCVSWLEHRTERAQQMPFEIPSREGPGFQRAEEPEPQPCEACGGSGKVYRPVTREEALDAGEPNIEGTAYTLVCGRCDGVGGV